jgi:class 3 adenylate cyclase/tetratricopeptide (TPR) repeat protein
VAVVCPNCAHENPDEARFCSSCGTPLTGQTTASPPIEERRVVSILFADLAGFTSRSDQADPEDVRRTLIPFHTIAKEEIERFGGTLDKFVGDAAMGVFGAPVAHEDDPERAVRAALAIQDRASETAIPVRAAVNTGEAVVTFATGPQVGENVAGDVVNTASRLQSIAPHGGVAVGEVTYRATAGAVIYRELEAVTVKGKADPLRVWVVESMREERPGRPDQDATPFVGRERERRVLRDLYALAMAERSLQVVTIVGDAGIGKTRLVADLHDHVMGADPSARWYRGRCLPYGESVTFAPLEEVVRDATGVKRSDDREEAARKLADRILLIEPGQGDAAWLSARLAPLLGLVEAGAGLGTNREESFAGWTRFLAAEASGAPTVLVIEDLHWADPAMLDFLDQLGEHLGEVALLLVCTTRPELFDARSEWDSHKPNTSTVKLAPLAEADMQQLLAELLVRSVLPAETQGPLVQSAGGNPLFALEFVRMLGDRDVVADASSIAVPESIHALIAARLDALTPAQRSLLQDAAVVGDPFWSGAIAHLATEHDDRSADAEADVAEPLRELQRRGLIAMTTSPTMEGEDEFSFTHGLIRDVAYGQIPRAGRAKRHLAVARWLEATAGDRLEERVELLAHHTSEALSLVQAAGLPEDVPALEDEARRFLVLAADRQSALDVAQAATYIRRALELTPAGRPERPRMLRRTAELGWRSGQFDVDAAVRTYEEAVELALEAGDHEEAALAMRRLYFQLGFRGDGEAARANIDRGIQLLEGHEPTPALAELYACRAEDEMFAGHSEASLRWADRALELPHTDAIAVMTLHIRGNGRCELGDLGGLDDLWEALRRAEAGGTALDLAQSYSYLSEWVGVTEGSSKGLELNDRAIDLCDRRGIQGQGMWARAESMWLLYDAGRWDDLLERTDTMIPWAEKHGDSIVGSIGLSYRARVLTHRGQEGVAQELLDRALEVAPQIGDLQVQAPVYVAAAVIEQARGNAEAALDHIRAFDEATEGGPTEYRELQSPEIVRVCLANHDVELAGRIVGNREVFVARTKDAVLTGRALLAEAHGHTEGALALFREAADAWETYGAPFERAQALEGAGRCLSALGRDEEAERTGIDARALFTALGVL